jgi:hypothetical protein
MSWSPAQLTHHCALAPPAALASADRLSLSRLSLSPTQLSYTDEDANGVLTQYSSTSIAFDASAADMLAGVNEMLRLDQRTILEPMRVTRAETMSSANLTGERRSPTHSDVNVANRHSGREMR